MDQPADQAAYHAGMRQLQDRFDTRRLADRLDEKLGRSAFTADDRAFIESRPLFFLASADAQGQPDCSYKGGDPGFVRVVGESELAFPSTEFALRSFVNDRAAGVERHHVAEMPRRF